MALLPDGNLLLTNRDRSAVEFGVHAETPFRPAMVFPGPDGLFGQSTVVPYWDDVPHSVHNLFCAGPSLLWNGNVFFAGGHALDDVGTYDTTLFDFRTRLFRPSSDMAYRRWYPTSLPLPNRRVLILSGTMDKMKYVGTQNICQVPEFWMSGLGANFNTERTVALVNSKKQLDRYFPQVFVDPKDGNVLFFGAGIRQDDIWNSYGVMPNRKLNLASLTWQEQNVLPSTVPNVRADFPSAVMIDGTVIRSGGARPGSPYDTDLRETEDAANAVSAAYQASATANYINLLAETPAWQKAGPTGQMALSRTNHMLIALPDGQVLAIGGNQHGYRKGAWERLAPEIWNPAMPQNPWTLLSPPPSSMRDGWGRGYHMTCTLLPDARIIMSGGETEYSATDVPPTDSAGRARIRRRGMIFSPPYGGTDNWAATRPTIQNAPSVIRYGQPFSISTRTSAGRQIASLSLIALAPMTHAYAPNQNLVFLNKGGFPVNAGPLTVFPPNSTWTATPGYYMLFAVDTAGIPSVAKIVQLRDLEPGYPHWSLCEEGFPLGTVSADALQMGDNLYLGNGIESDKRVVKVHAAAKLQLLGRTSKLRIQLEGSTTRNTKVLAEALDWTTGTWVSLGEKDLTNVDSQVEWVVTGSAAARLAQSGSQLVRTRFSIFASGEFRAKIDLVEFGGLPGLGNGSFMQP